MKPNKLAKVISNPEFPCPSEILNQQLAIKIIYFGFDSHTHIGEIEVNNTVAKEVIEFFSLALSLKFPIEKVSRSSDEPFKWNDDRLMAANISSGFNYRLVAGSSKISRHGLGLAIDINPRQNPYVRIVNGKELIAPYQARYDPGKPGTLTTDHQLVHFMLSHGWDWGSNWLLETGRVDYQHFQKLLV